MLPPLVLIRCLNIVQARDPDSQIAFQGPRPWSTLVSEQHTHEQALTRCNVMYSAPRFDRTTPRSTSEHWIFIQNSSLRIILSKHMLYSKFSVLSIL
ncbi:hypothetical protein F4680DRAFT_412341 [Xylaria scruposa]|nr:hypothetical protein F4680DRAFT_412341 [Xylaria scruposa]